MALTLGRPAAFKDSCAKTTGSHMALCTNNSGAESGRELFKGSKSSSLHPKNFFCLRGTVFFVSDVLSIGRLSHPGPLHLALNANHLMVVFC